MWRCKKCGGEMQAEIDLIYGVCRLDKNKKPIISTNDIQIDSVYCEVCGNCVVFTEELEDIAEYTGEGK